MPGIYLKHGDRYVAMSEQPYDAERILQELIASHPEMLAGDDAGHGPLLFVGREIGIAEVDEAGARFSLDHLYLDARGVPTLVEVKRSSDTRSRREVVAQMLDYAANARTSLNAEQLEAWVAEQAQRRGHTTDDLLLDAFGTDFADDFWQAVRTNLEAEKMRLVFVSDAIGSELQKIIEFLNRQFSQTEVLAIEVKQYVDEHREHQTIVPRVIGDTQRARQTKRIRSVPLDHARLLAALKEHDSDSPEAARGVLAWAERHPALTVAWSRAADIRFAKRILLRIWQEGTLEVTLKTLTLDPRWNDTNRLQALIDRLQEIDGIRFEPGKLNWPRTVLAPLADADRLQQFTAVLDEVLLDLDLGTTMRGTSV